jgi:hypothetical protein
MEKKSNKLLPGPTPASGGTPTALYGQLDALNEQVNKLLSDPNIRRVALEVGIVLLAKRYPALSFLLGSLGGTGVKQTPAPRHAAARRPAPAKKRGRGIR